jgi:hypothetical protein
MKQKFLKDLGIDLDETTDDLLQQFDLNGFMDEISDNRLKEEDKKVEELKDNLKEDSDNKGKE